MLANPVRRGTTMLLTIIFIYCLIMWLVGASWVLEMEMFNWKERVMGLGFIIIAPIVIPLIMVAAICHKYS